MSRWLKSVNNLLETLDGTAENVASTDPTTIPTSRGAIGQILSARGMDYDDEDDFDDDDDYDDDYDDEEGYEDEEQEDQAAEEEVVDFSNSPEEGLVVTAPAPKQAAPPPPPPAPSEPQIQEITKPKTVSVQAPPPPPVSEPSVVAGEYASDYTSDGAVIVGKRYGDVDSVTTEEPSSPPANDSTASAPLSAANMPLLKSAPQSGLSVVTTSADKLQQQLKKYKQESKKAQTETRQLRKHVMQLNEELESSEAEVKAQQEELLRAAERMEKDRQRANEDREDLMDEEEEELENQKVQYEKELKEQKERYEDQLEELEERIANSEEKRMQEGGDWTKELEDTIQREREGIKKVNGLKEENAALKSSVAKLETQHEALQAKLESSGQANQTASNREREAEDKLDASLSLHSRQMSQRLAREAELERAIADLGAALARSRQKEKSGPSPQANTDNSSMKEQFEMAVDELETVRAQLILEIERCDALRNELADISKERTAEASEVQTRQRQHSREVSDLRSTVTRLQKSVRDRKSTTVALPADADASDFFQKLEESKKQVASLSEQLIRQQNASQNSNQEILALKNRLQSATTRAESAEDALVATSSSRNAFEVEGGMAYGGASMRRRVKGGRSRGTSTVRSIRSSLGMNPGRVGDGMEQVALTIDAIDSWLIDTGAFMKHEPLARLGFVLYLCILHLWSFCLVVFHASTYEDVHGDFGSMGDPSGHGPQHLLGNNQP